jgi:ClpP class serine protease
MRYIEKLANAPWLADQEHVEFLHGLYLSYLERAASGQPLDRSGIEAIETSLGRPLDNARAVTVREGVARIPVEGTIARRTNLFTAISGGVSTEVLARDLVTARDDPGVHSILLVFDSPGGEAAGINELAGMIREIRDAGDTRIESYADGTCASAAYWLASATSRITADATASLGSIGVVTRVRNPESADKREPLEFWNARSPYKRLDPTSERGRGAIQRHVDDMGDEFIGAVADNRGVSTETVTEDFGQGFVLTGRRAVEAGMADALGSEEQVMQRLIQPSRREETVVDTRSAPHVADTDPVPVTTETREAEGMMARLRSMLGLESQTSAPTATLEETANGGNKVKLEDRDGAAVLVADSGEELELSADDREKLTADETEALRAENEQLKIDRDHYASQVASLTEQSGEALDSAAEQAAENELLQYADSGVQKYMLDYARPKLVAAHRNPADQAAHKEAESVRGILSGAPKMEHGERGNSGGSGSRPTSGMSDDEKVRATLSERGLGMGSYGTVAGELVAAGEIDRDAVTSVDAE